MLDEKQLVDIAIKAQQLSYTPYSNFAVGAAILCKDGEVFRGANIENASYPLCMCAERNAIYNAMLHGKKKDDFVMIAIVANSDEACSPCGACRQVMSELLPKDCKIIMANTSNKIHITTLEELLPYAFSSEDLK